MKSLFRPPLSPGNPITSRWETVLLFVLAIVLSPLVHSQCGMVPVSLEQRVQSSAVVIEGRVIGSEARWDDLHHNIYTIHAIEVLSTFKGSPDTIVYLATQGGNVGMDLEIPTHTLELNAGKTGIFTLVPSTKPIQAGYPLYEAFAGIQGFLQYSRADRDARGVFDHYPAITADLYPAIEALSGAVQARRKAIDWNRVNDKSYSLNSLLTIGASNQDHLTADTLYAETTESAVASGASITSFSPTTVQAGRWVVLTINGSGFGATQGSSYVQFTFASSSGGYTTPSAGQYISWSDTQIKLYVPTAAGTGTFRVTDGTNTATSPSSLTVEYSILNVLYSSEYYSAPIINDNGSGGYTFQMNTAFDASTAAKNDFQDVVYAWRCETGIAWTFGSVSTVTTSASDGTNVVRFDAGSELPTGTLGVCVSRYSGCADGNGIVYFSLTEMDVSVDDGANFFYGSSGSPSGSQYDFYSVMIHELGHGHQLAHVLDATKVMHPSINPGVQRRTLAATEVTGANYVVTQGTSSSNCSNSVHIQYSCNPSVTLSASSTSVTEGGTSTITATLSKPAFSAVTVTLTLTGTATTTTDYTLGTTITIPAGSTSASITLTTVDDVNDEPAETVIANITGVTNGTESGTQVVTVTIADNDNPPTVTLSASSTSISETGGTSTITATLSAASAYAITVGVTLTGTATTGTDYTLATTFSIPAGSTSASLALSSVGDALDEQNETVIIDITSVINCTENGTQTVTVTINDDDATPTVSLSASATSIGETSSTSTITATLSAISGQAVTVTLSTSGTATQGTDYNLSSTITIAAGLLSASTNLSTVNDLFDEPNETAIIDIASVTNATENGTQTVTVTINDDDVPPTITMTTSNTTITEGSSATLTFTVSAYSGFPITINLGTSGTATAADFTLPSSVTIPAWSSTATATLSATDDVPDEASETVIVDIVSITNGTENGTQQQTITIYDTDPAPEAVLSTGSSSIAENGGSTTITATLSGVTYLPVTVNLAYSGTAASGSDYTYAASFITIPAGSLTGSTTVTAVNDAMYENAETISITMSGVTNADIGNNTPRIVTITDDDTPPSVTLSVSANTITEGATVTVTATLSSISSIAVTVDLSTSGTALSYHYSMPSGITIPAGSLSASITLTTNDSGADEASETVIIDISSVSNAVESGTQQQTVTILDNDPPTSVMFYLQNTSVSESAGTTGIGILCLTDENAQPITCTFTYSGTALSGTDYTQVASVTLPAWGFNAGAQLPIIDDLLDEIGETVIITVGCDNGIPSSTQSTLTILDDDNPPTATLSVQNTAIAENGSTTVTAALSAVSGLPVTVNLGFSGTAAAGDYTAGSVITIPAGSLTGSVTLSAVDDATDEPDETVSVSILSADNATPDAVVPVVTIQDNDAQPNVSLSLNNASIAEDGSALLSATLSAVSSYPVTVNLSFTGTASGSDYSPVASITIPAGSLSQTVTISAVDDAIDEADETVIFTIASATSATPAGSAQTLTILDNDNAPDVSLMVSSAAIPENGAATITASLSAVSSFPVTVNLTYTGTASGSDYTSAAAITIPADSLSQAISITAVEDAIDETDETVIAAITSAVNATAAGSSQTITIQDNDDPPTATLSAQAAAIAENGSTTVTATLSSVSALTVTVQLGFAGTASAGDYTAGSSIVIPAGSTTGSVTLAAVDDLIDEADETVVVFIASASNATAGAAAQTVTITDNDNAPTVAVTVADAVIAENGATTITASLSGISGLAITVNLGFSGTAAASDYTAGSSITIPAGSTTGSVTLAAIDDLVDEADETVAISIASATNATVGGATQTVMITDNDNAPTATLTAANTVIAENGATTVTVTLSEASALAATVNLGFSGTASTSDYTAGSSIIIPAGSTTGSVTLTAIDDLIDEADETVTISIASATNAAAGGSTPTVTITDNDATPVPEIALAVTGNDLSSGSNYDFGTVASGTTADAVISITNTGGADLLLTDAALVQLGGSPAFSLTTTGMAAVLAAGESTDFTVHFTADCSAGTVFAQLIVPNNDADESSFTLTLSGTSSDETAPEIVCPADIQSASAVVSYALPTATDNCGTAVVTLVSGPASGATFPEGQTTVTYSATDAAGNSTTCSFTVFVETVGITEQEDASLVIYPNPAGDVVTVSVPEGYATVTIFDMHEKVISREVLKELVTTLPTSALPSGLYYFSFEGSAGAAMRKVEIAH